MISVIRAVMVLILQLMIYYLFGVFIHQYVGKNQKREMIFKIVTGFLAYQCLFQVCALPMIQWKQTVTRLAGVWGILVAVLCGMAILAGRKEIADDGKAAVRIIKEYKGSVLLLALVLTAMCYYVSTNGELNEDSRYYIGLVNTTLTTDRFYEYNVYSGLQMDSYYLRRALVTFDIETAVVCKICGLHPLLVTRITRASLNLLLTGGTAYLFGKLLCRDRKEVFPGAAAFAEIALISNFAFDNTIYAGAEFLLHRTYEGKAYAGNVLIFFTIYLCVCNMLSAEKSNYFYLALTLWASIAVSSSAIMVTGAASVIFMLPQWLIRLRGGVGRDKIT